MVLSQHVDTAGAMELLTLGADGIGYLLKRRVMNLDEFLDSVHRVVAGGSSIDPEVISSMVRRGVRDNRDQGIARLTPRRLEVLELMAQGFSNARIAREMVVTEKAVARSIGLIFQTLGLPPSRRSPAGAGGHAIPERLTHAGGAGPTAVSDDTVDRRRSPGPLIG